MDTQKKMFCYNFFLGGCCVNMDVFFTQEITCKNTCFFCFVFVFVFFLSWFSFTDIDDSQDSRGREGGDHLLFHSTTSTRSRTFRYLFATLHVRWLSHIFNHTASIYQTTTRCDLPPYRTTIWLIDDVKLVTLVSQANRLTKCASHPNQVC